MKLKCKPFFQALSLMGLFLLPGCFPEGEDGCPEDMLLSFYLDDDYVLGDTYDSRVGNDVYMYVFLDRMLLTVFTVPYDQISSGRDYVYSKYDGFEGNMDMVGCAVARTASGVRLPDLSEGGVAVELTPDGNDPGRYLPAGTDLYLGSVSAVEKVDQPSRHRIPMGVASCRVEVNITDHSDVLAGAGSRFVEIAGTMSQMTMGKTGTGIPAVVIAPLEEVGAGGEIWQTGRFGVLPSSEGQTVSADIYVDGSSIQTLEVPGESLPRGAQAGGLIIFDYTIGDAHYYLTIDGFTEKIVIVDEI